MSIMIQERPKYKLTNFGKRLRQYRIDNKMHLRDMAQLIGVTSSYLCSMERGVVPVSSEISEKITLLFFS